MTGFVAVIQFVKNCFERGHLFEDVVRFDCFRIGHRLALSDHIQICFGVGVKRFFDCLLVEAHLICIKV
jgi:hypothetical protein